MMDLEALHAFAREIARANDLDQDTADLYAALIGDTPEVGEDGICTVRDSDGREITRIKLPGWSQ
jgi:hypothetical protein